MRGLEDTLLALRERNEDVPSPVAPATRAQVAQAERDLHFTFHPDFVQFLTEASDITHGTFEPGVLAEPGTHLDLLRIARSGWEDWGIPRDVLPFCEDNADFFCMRKDGSVFFWSHDGLLGPEEWPSLADWIADAWMATD